MTRSLQPSTASTVPMGDSYASTQSQLGDDGNRRTAIKHGAGMFGALSGLSKAAESLFQPKAAMFHKPHSATKQSQSYQKSVGSTGDLVLTPTGASLGGGFATPGAGAFGPVTPLASSAVPPTVPSNEENVAAAVAAMASKKRKVAPSAKRARPPTTTVDHAYNDYSCVTDDQALKSAEERKNTGGVITPFQEKLHEMLTTNVDIDVIDWAPHGRCFIVRKPKEFTQTVLPKYFKHQKLTSFQRQLNLYGFKRITKGRDQGAYYHELFLRGRPKLCKRMRRQKVKGTGHKPLPDPDNEPDFYQMEFLPDPRSKGPQPAHEEAKPPALPSEDTHMNEDQQKPDDVRDMERIKDMNREEQLEEIPDVLMEDEPASVGDKSAFSDDDSVKGPSEDNVPLQPLIIDERAVPDGAPSSRVAIKTAGAAPSEPKVPKRQSLHAGSFGQSALSPAAMSTSSGNGSGLNDLSSEIQIKREEIRRLMQEEQRLILLHQQQQQLQQQNQGGSQGFGVPSSSQFGSVLPPQHPVHTRGQPPANLPGFFGHHQSYPRTSNHPNLHNIEPVPFSHVSTPDVVSSRRMDVEGGHQPGSPLPDGGIGHNTQVPSQNPIVPQPWWHGSAPAPFHGGGHHPPHHAQTAIPHHQRNQTSPKRNSLSMSSESGSQSLFGRVSQRMAKGLSGWPSTSKKSDYSSNGSDDWVNDDDLTRNSLDGNIDFDEIFESCNFRNS